MSDFLINQELILSKTFMNPDLPAWKGPEPPPHPAFEAALIQSKAFRPRL